MRATTTTTLLTLCISLASLALATNAGRLAGLNAGDTWPSGAVVKADGCTPETPTNWYTGRVGFDQQDPTPRKILDRFGRLVGREYYRAGEWRKEYYSDGTSPDNTPNSDGSYSPRCDSETASPVSSPRRSPSRSPSPVRTPERTSPFFPDPRSEDSPREQQPTPHYCFAELPPHSEDSPSTGRWWHAIRCPQRCSRRAARPANRRLGASLSSSDDSFVERLNAQLTREARAYLLQWGDARAGENERTSCLRDYDILQQYARYCGRTMDEAREGAIAEGWISR